MSSSTVLLSCSILSVISFLSSLLLWITIFLCKILISRNKQWKYVKNNTKKYTIFTTYLFYWILCDCLFSLSLIIYFRNFHVSSLWQCILISFLSQFSFSSLSIWCTAFIFILWRYSNFKSAEHQHNKTKTKNSMRLLSNSEKYETSYNHYNATANKEQDHIYDFACNPMVKFFPYLSNTQIKRHHIIIWLLSLIFTCLPFIIKLLHQQSDTSNTRDAFCWITDMDHSTNKYFGIPFYWLSSCVILYLLYISLRIHCAVCCANNNHNYYIYLRTFAWCMMPYILCMAIACGYRYRMLLNNTNNTVHNYIRDASNISVSLYGLLSTLIWFNNNNLIAMIKEITFIYNRPKYKQQTSSKIHSLSELYRLSVIISYKKRDNDLYDHYEAHEDDESDAHKEVLPEILNAYEAPKKQSNVESHPHDDTNVFTEYTYLYMLPLMKKGYKKIIELEDLTLPPHIIQLRYLYARFLECYVPKRKEDCAFTFQVLQSLLQVNKQWLIRILLCNICSEFFEIGGVFAFRELINFLYSSDPMYYGILYAVAMALTKECSYICTARGWVIGDRAGIGARNLLMGLIFRKSLLIPQYALIDDGANTLSTGQILNTMSNDTERINYMFKLGSAAIGSSINIFICIAFMIYMIGIESIAGLCVGLLLIPFNVYFGKYMGSIKLSALVFSDERVKFLCEILNGIRVIKMYCWENPLQQKISEWRNKEINGFKQVYNARSLFTSVLTNADYIIVISILSLKVWLNKPINVIEVYLVIQFTNTIRTSLNKAAYVNHLIDGWVAVKRIQHFFDICDYYKPLKTRSMATIQEEEASLSGDMDHKEDDTELLIEIENAVFCHKPGSDLNKLHIDHLNIYRNQLIAIIGSVGSGKSSLMESLLNEKYYDTKNRLSSFTFHKDNMKFCWVNQCYFIMNGSIRENIIMSNAFDANDYNKVIEACSMIYDLKLFPAGDQTEIGEKGINLSGGQRARICIARALYEHQHNHDVDVLLFDDSLSAVDNDVALHIFKHCILGIGDNITRIVIMNSHLKFLKYFDRVLVLEYNDDEAICNIVEDTCDFNILKEKYKGLLETHHDDIAKEQQMEKDKELQFEHEVQQTKLDVMKENIVRKTSVYEDGESLLSLANINEIQSEKQRLVSKDAFAKMAKLVSTEDRVRGAMNSNPLIEYLNAGSSLFHNGIILFIILFIFFLMTQSLWISFDIWLSWWGAAGDTSATDGDDNAWKPFFDAETLSDSYWMTVCWIFTGSILVIGFIRAMLLYNICLNASNEFEQGILARVLHTTISYFDATPIGRITNRFSRDLAIIDSELPVTIELISLRSVMFVSYVVVLSIFIPYYILFLLPTIYVIVKLRNFYIATSREIKRIDGVTRSPIYNIFNETIFGLQTIRAFKYQKYFINKFELQININSRAYFDFMVTGRTLSIMLESIVVLQGLFIAIAVIFLGDSIAPNIAALCISYATTFSGQFQYMIRLTAEFETQLTAVERLHALSQIEQEAAHYKDEYDDKCTALQWPNSGRIEFKNLRFKYREHLPLVLKGISCDIASGTRVGICGRTGAGKSSIMVCLFRLFEFESGIYIDDVDISQLGLFMLRSNICIIPQEPILLSGTLRFNIDPFDKYGDDEIIEVLRNVFLWDFIKEKKEGIYYEITENGLNLSKGQRQLVCICRALLKKPKILLLDEATSNIDAKNDKLIQQSITNNFRNTKCTILTIAHRLNTIIDYDRIMVLENGQIVEFDAPQKLLNDSNGTFYKLYHNKLL